MFQLSSSAAACLVFQLWALWRSYAACVCNYLELSWMRYQRPCLLILVEFEHYKLAVPWSFLYAVTAPFVETWLKTAVCCKLDISWSSIEVVTLPIIDSRRLSIVDGIMVTLQDGFSCFSLLDSEALLPVPGYNLQAFLYFYSIPWSWHLTF